MNFEHQFMSQANKNTSLVIPFRLVLAKVFWEGSREIQHEMTRLNPGTRGLVPTAVLGSGGDRVRPPNLKTQLICEYRRNPPTYLHMQTEATERLARLAPAKAVDMAASHTTVVTPVYSGVGGGKCKYCVGRKSETSFSRNR